MSVPALQSSAPPVPPPLVPVVVDPPLLELVPPVPSLVDPPVPVVLVVVVVLTPPVVLVVLEPVVVLVVVDAVGAAVLVGPPVPSDGDSPHPRLGRPVAARKEICTKLGTRTHKRMTDERYRKGGNAHVRLQRVPDCSQRLL